MKLVNLTDENILKYTHGREVITIKDFNLKYGKRGTDEVRPVHGGIYDPEYFGSLYNDRCNCGSIKLIGKYCHKCNSEILPIDEKLSRFAYIKSPVLYISKYKIKSVTSLLQNVLYDSDSNKDINKEIKLYNTSTSLYYDSLFNHFELDAENNIIGRNTFDGSEKYVSIEGLLLLMEEIEHHDYEELSSYFNKLVIVIPSELRKVSFFIMDNRKTLSIPKSSSIYRAIKFYIDFVNEAIKKEEDIKINLYHKNILRSFISIGMENISEINNTSKDNFTRKMISQIIPNSGRAPIVPDIDIPIDTIKLPIGLAYELYKKEFITHLMDDLLIPINEARYIYVHHEKSTLNKFKKFVTDKVVIIIRNPTIHKYNILGVKVDISNDYTIHIPPMICKSFNADFDGDQMAFYKVSDKFKDDIMEKISPKNRLHYEKNKKPIFSFSHEFLYGIYLGTKINLSDTPKTVNSKEEAYKMYEDGLIYSNDLISINSNLTTYGRLKVSEIIEFDLNSIVYSEAINSKNISDVVNKIYSFEDRLEKLKLLQDFSVEIMRSEGITTLNLKEIYIETDADIKNKIYDILDSDLEKSLKNIRVSELYNEFLSRSLLNVSGKAKETVASSDRIKINQLIDISIPNLVTDNKGNIRINKNSLYDGLSQDEYNDLAWTNRNILNIKVDLVPKSGYLARQLTYLGQIYKYSKENANHNHYIELPSNLIIGRLDINGKKIEKDQGTKISKVNSCIFNEDFFIYKNQLNTVPGYEDDDNIGASLATSATEGIIQGGLALKHGGTFKRISDEHILKATDDGKVISLKDNKLLVEYNGVKKTYFVTNKFIVNLSEFKAGEVIGYINYMITPSYKLDSLIKLLKAGNTLNSSKLKVYVNTSNSVSLYSGVINYEIDNANGLILIKVDKKIVDSVDLNSDTLIPYPDGEHIKKYSKVNSNILDMKHLISKEKDKHKKIMDIYYAFRTQFKILIDTLSEDIIEFIFMSNLDNKNITFSGVQNSTKKTLPLGVLLTSGYSSKHLSTAINKNIMDIKNPDPFSNLFFKLLMKS